MSLELSKPNNENENLLSNDDDSVGLKNAGFLGIPFAYFAKYFIHGLLNTASIGDYFLFLWIMLSLLRSKENSEKVLDTVESDSLSKYIIVFEVFILTCTIGLTETTGIYGSQAVGGGRAVVKFEDLNGDETEFDGEDISEILSRPYQIMTQGKTVASIILLIGTPIFLKLAPYVVSLSSGGTNDNGETLFWLIIALTPAAVIKLFVDQEKHFLFCFQKYRLVGIFSLINVIASTLIGWILLKMKYKSIIIVIVTLTLFQIFNWISVEIALEMEFTDKEKKLYLSPRLCPRKKILTYTWEFLKNSFTELYFPVLIQVMFLIVKISCTEVENIYYISFFKTMRFTIFVTYGFYIWPRTKINYELGKNIYVKDNAKKRQVKGDYFWLIVKMNLIIFALFTIFGIIFSIVMAKKAVKHYRSELKEGAYEEEISSAIYIYCFFIIYIFLNVPFISGCMRSINMKYILIIYNTLAPYFILPFLYYLKFMKKKATDIFKPKKLMEGFLNPVDSLSSNESGLTLKIIYLYMMLELIFRIFFYLSFLWLKNNYDDVGDDLVFKLADEDDVEKTIA